MQGLSPRSLFDLSAGKKVRIYTGGNNGLSCLAKDIAIERQHADAKLMEAWSTLLTREMSHRLKNSLISVVGGLIRVQVRRSARNQ
jgi:hypothetical protein